MLLCACCPGARIVGGSVLLEGEELLEKSPREIRAVRGRRIATIIQDPMSSLDPLFTIYDQVAEPAYYHRALRGRRLLQRVQELLTAVRIPSPEARMREFPHQMSGGMRQRIVGAIAQAGGPQIIIADELHTNLDVTIQLQYLNLLKDLQRTSGVALIFVTHNLGIVAKMCDKVAVMYAGKIVEQQPVRDLFYTPRHPTPGRCSTRCRSSAVRSRYTPSPGSRQIPRLCLQAVASTPLCACPGALLD